MTARERLRELQIQIYEANERRARELVAAPRRYARCDLDRYERDLNRSIPPEWDISTPAALRAAIRRSRVVLVGDYHTLRQSQRGFLRALRVVRSRHLIVGLEFVMAPHQRAVDAYCDGRIDEETFLRRIRYAHSWPSYQVWPNFKPLFDHARSRGARVLALDCDPSQCATVFSRASFMAWRIVEALRESPGSRVMALIGENHLAPGHLPAALRAALGQVGVEASVLTVHQNLDPIWFDLIRRGIEDRVDVVRLASDRFVVPVSSPIAAQQSFLAAVAGEDVVAGSGAALKRDFARYIRGLARTFNLPSRGVLEGVTVCGPHDLGDLSSMAERVGEEAWRLLAEQVAEGESLCLPEYDLVYLANISATHVAEEAAHFLKARLASGPIPADAVDFFYSRVLHETIGYFGAKVFNPKRKPPSGVRLTEAATRALDARGGELNLGLAFAVQAAAWHRRNQSRRSFRSDSFDAWLRSSLLGEGIEGLAAEVVRPIVHVLGYDLGERLFLAFHGGAIGARDVKRLFMTSFEAPGKAFVVFHRLAMSLKGVTLPKRF